jgi:phosphatidyl-myo-inositol alpha-mannosyltransferase
MKVGIVCPYDLSAPGGVQQLSIELKGRLERAGDEVVLAGPGSGDWVSLGPVVPVTANGSRVPITLARSVRATVSEAMAGVDVIHLHEPLIPLVGWVTLQLEQAMVLTFHADPPEWARRLYRWAPARLSASLRARPKTAVSAVARQALPSEWGDVEVIPNAIDVPAYRLETPRRPKRVVFLGRDEPRKGLDTVIEAWPTVMATHPDAELVVIGAARSQGPPGVQFAGRVREAEKRSLLASATVFVAPNLGGESFGIVLAEAMAAGCAVIASDLPAFRAVGEHGATYVTPGDVAEWAETIITMLAAPEWAESLSRAGRRLSVRYDWPRALESYRSTYRRAVESV